LTAPWTFAGQPPDELNPATSVVLVEGSTFCISARTGDLRPGSADGLFVRDTRVLSRWQLTVDEVSPRSLAVRRIEPFAAAYLARLPPPPGRADSSVLTVRRRFIGDGMREDITVRNLAAEPVRCVVRLSVDADFADLFEVKEGRVAPPADVDHRIVASALSITRRRGLRTLGVLVRAEGEPAVRADGVRWEVELAPRAAWTTIVEVFPTIDGRALELRHTRDQDVEQSGPAVLLREWRRSSPVVSTADRHLAAVLTRSVEDLGSLRIYDPDHPERAVVAAGVPWFMALFGRDSLLTSWMLLPIDPSLAIGTLQTLADHQGSAEHDASEEEPGRILHEIRFGPASDFAVGGRSVYFGTADATPLFVMLLGELQRWGVAPEAIDRLLPHADRALRWIEEYGDADGDGFVEYRRKTDAGLVNQGWKDSWDGITFADGRIPHAPLALAEVQAYCYAAFRARAHFAAGAGEQKLQAHWLERAAQLKRSFNERFWLPDRGWFALGLDADKRPIDALGSNMGHCLWTGIVDADKAEAVADLLVSPEMFSGWGLRTLSSSMAAYNPMSYHNGSVWPHDTALCASGLMRYGYVGHAQRLIEGLLDAASYFDHRLPELFCGFGRNEFPVPVPYPTSCSPQAWAAATPFLLLRSLLRFHPELPAGQIRCTPAVPARYLPLGVSNLRVAGMSLDLDVQPDGWHLDGLDGSPIELVGA
jgi:glycogen debranching enzyme